MNQPREVTVNPNDVLNTAIDVFNRRVQKRGDIYTHDIRRALEECPKTPKGNAEFRSRVELARTNYMKDFEDASSSLDATQEQVQRLVLAMSRRLTALDVV